MQLAREDRNISTQCCGDGRVLCVQDNNEVAFQCCVHSAEVDEDHYISKG